MSFVMNLVLVAQILSALGMVGLILVQHGKGADMGAAFGSGSSGSLFGASGSANFLSRSTAVLATVFLASTLLLSYYSFSPRVEASGGSVLEGVKAPETVQPDAAAAIPARAAASHATPQNEGNRLMPIREKPSRRRARRQAMPPSRRPKIKNLALP